MNILPADSGRCPFCHAELTDLWADDGESDLADYWECHACGATGAIVDPSDPTRTQNGLLVNIPSGKGLTWPQVGVIVALSVTAAAFLLTLIR